jgi:hypothetical protein
MVRYIFSLCWLYCHASSSGSNSFPFTLARRAASARRDRTSYSQATSPKAARAMAVRAVKVSTMTLVQRCQFLVLVILLVVRLHAMGIHGIF